MLCDDRFDCSRRQSRLSEAPAQLFAARTAAKQTKVVRTESWIRRSLSRSLWGCQGRARTMREKFEMKINVASRTDRVPFTVWIKRLHRTDDNPVRCCLLLEKRRRS